GRRRGDGRRRRPGHARDEDPGRDARDRIAGPREARAHRRREAPRAGGGRALRPPGTGAPLMAQVPPARVDKAVALRGSQLLRDFTDVGVKILAEIVEQRTVGNGNYAFKAGEASEKLAFVAKGTLQLLPADGGA